MVENDVNSKFLRVLLIIFAAFLIFAGPTYVSYVLFDVLNVNYVASVVSGIALFIAGLLLMLFLIRKKIVT
jgi:pilus assembly protein TadC